MARVLRPGGQIALICAGSPGFSEWFALLDSALASAVADPGLSLSPALPTASEVSSLLQAAGIAVEHMQNPVTVQRILRPEPFVRLMCTVAPLWTADLPEPAQMALEQLLSHVIRTGWPGGFPNTWSAILAVGIKVTG